MRERIREKTGKKIRLLVYVRVMDLNFQNTRSMKRHETASFTSILIDSRDRDHEKFPNASRYTVDLPQTFHHVTEAKLVSAELPSSFYVFSTAEQNTSLDVEVDGTRKSITIPDGNYGLQTMTNAIKTRLESAFSLEGHAFTVSTSASNLRLTIETDDPNVTFRIHSGDYVPNTTHWGLAYYLGFERDRTYTSVDGVLEGDRPVSLNPITYLLLDIEEFGTLQESELFGRGGSASHHTFAKVPIQVDSFKYAFYDKAITHNTFRPPIPRLQKLRVSWRHHSGLPVDFQGLEHSLTIQITHTPLRTN